MGQKRSDKWKHLPPRMLARDRGKVYYFYYASNGANRVEIPLGKDLAIAKARYCAIEQIEPIEIPPPDAAKALFRLVKKNGRAKGVEITLTEEDVAAMLVESRGKCAITGIPFSYRKTPAARRFRAWVPSVDRIEPGGPYSRDNTRIVCAAVNIAMNQLGDEVFYMIAARAAMKQKLLRK